MERKERIKAIWVAEQHVPTRTDCRFCDIDESFFCDNCQMLEDFDYMQ